MLIVPRTFFEVRPMNHLKKIVVEDEGSFFFRNELIFLDLRSEK